MELIRLFEVSCIHVRAMTNKKGDDVRPVAKNGLVNGCEADLDVDDTGDVGLVSRIILVVLLVVLRVGVMSQVGATVIDVHTVFQQKLDHFHGVVLPVGLDPVQRRVESGFLAILVERALVADALSVFGVHVGFRLEQGAGQSEVVEAHSHMQQRRGDATICAHGMNVLHLGLRSVRPVLEQQGRQLGLAIDITQVMLQSHLEGALRAPGALPIAIHRHVIGIGALVKKELDKGHNILIRRALEEANGGVKGGPPGLCAPMSGFVHFGGRNSAVQHGSRCFELASFDVFHHLLLWYRLRFAR
mmetsp:Transcript_11039/g.16282  ORF Transcript_11039/g.16282 Transcript_11039/m.16282 type:complete len:302 (+) Transcript_11039:686-1591(+)